MTMALRVRYLTRKFRRQMVRTLELELQTCFDVYDRPHDVMRNCHVVIMVFVI